MKIFENLFKVEDFSTLIEDFLKIEKSSTFTKICENFWKFGINWRFFKFWSNLKIIQILVKIQDIWKFGQNWKWRFLKIWPKLKIFQILVKIEDFANFKKSLIKVEKSSILNKIFKNLQFLANFRKSSIIPKFEKSSIFINFSKIFNF